MTTQNSKSVYVQLEEGSFVVKHGGESHTFRMARYTDSLSGEILQDEDLIVAWARQEGVLHRLICAGLRQDLITQRGLVRKKDKDEKPITITEGLHATYQKAIRKHRPALLTPPKAAQVKVDLVKHNEDMAAGIVATGLQMGHSDEQIIMLLAAIGIEEDKARDMIAAATVDP